MVDPAALQAFVVSTSAITTAGAAVAAARWVRDLRSEVTRNSRLLVGVEDRDEWGSGGVVRVCRENREALVRCGLFPRCIDEDTPEEVRQT